MEVKFKGNFFVHTHTRTHHCCFRHAGYEFQIVDYGDLSKGSKLPIPTLKNGGAANFVGSDDHGAYKTTFGFGVPTYRIDTNLSDTHT